jgi:hypothetical protein
MSQFPGQIPVLETKSEARDAVSSTEKFINGRDINDIHDEIGAIAANLGAFQKFESTFEGEDVTVGSGTTFFGLEKIDFPGDIITVTGSVSIWLTVDGVLEQGDSFPSGAHFPVCSVTHDGFEITEIEDKRIFFTVAGISASGTAYEPSSPAAWPDPDPTTVQEALDDLILLVGSGAGTASGITYTPEVPADWDAPDPTNVQDALDDIAARVSDIERVVPTVGSGSLFNEYPIHPVYPQAVEFGDGPIAIAYGREAIEAREQYYHIVQPIAATGSAIIQFKYQLPKRMDSLDSIGINSYKSGTPDEMVISLFGEDGTPDVGIDETSIIPSVSEDFEMVLLTPSGTYDPGEVICIELKVTLSTTTAEARLGRIVLGLSQ